MALTPYLVAIAALSHFFPNFFTPDSECSTVAAWLSELPPAPPATHLKLTFFQTASWLLPFRHLGIYNGQNDTY